MQFRLFRLCLRACILITPEICWVETINYINNRTQWIKIKRGKRYNLVDINRWIDIDPPRWVCLYRFEPKRLNNSVRRHPTQHVLPTSTWSRDLGVVRASFGLAILWSRVRAQVDHPLTEIRASIVCTEKRACRWTLRRLQFTPKYRFEPKRFN